MQIQGGHDRASPQLDRGLTGGERSAMLQTRKERIAMPCSRQSTVQRILETGVGVGIITCDGDGRLQQTYTCNDPRGSDCLRSL